MSLCVLCLLCAVFAAKQQSSLRTIRTTVVVTTTNLNGQTGAQGNGNILLLSAGAVLTERFTWVAVDTIQYDVTVNDPATWTRRWTASFPLQRDPGYAMLEYACHEETTR
jgi:hypothetical protein